MYTEIDICEHYTHSIHINTCVLAMQAMTLDTLVPGPPSCASIQILAGDSLGLLSIYSVRTGRLSATKRIAPGVPLLAIERVLNRQMVAAFTAKEATLWRIGAWCGVSVVWVRMPEIKYTRASALA